MRDEPLAPNFSGVLGLALPLNSIIAGSIPPVTTNEPDGAAWASNLFSITPTDQAPATRFLSLSLSRPGSDKVPSLLGIGRHPAALVPNPSKVLYSTLVTDRAGILFWKVNIRAITVYVDGVPHPVTLGRSASGGAFPTAVLDSGVPVILTTRAIANAIYGAIGIDPASDGKCMFLSRAFCYFDADGGTLVYVPCKTPLNLTMTIDNRPEFPLHPLDLTADPPDDNKADFCIGLIQSVNGLPSTIGDMVLGVPFLRNFYTVMAYAIPNSDGSFSRDPTTNSSNAHITPRLGLMPLTDPTQALNEFNTVRVLNKPISSGGSPNSTGVGDTNTVNVGRTKLSMGIMVLIGLASFFVLCGVLFLLCWLLPKLKKARSNKAMNEPGDLDKETAYRLVRGGLLTAGAELSEDEKRVIRFQRRKREELGLTGSTMSSDRTRVESLSYGKKFENGEVVPVEGEFGIRTKSGEDADDVWNPLTAVNLGDDTDVGSNRRGKDGLEYDDALVLDRDNDSNPPSSPGHETFPHRRDHSDPERAAQLQHHQQRSRSVDVPLLSAQHDAQAPPPHADGDVTNEMNVLTSYVSHSESPSRSPPTLPGPPPLPSDDYYYSKTDEFGGLRVTDDTSMAGVGTASQTKKLTKESTFMGAIVADEGRWSPSLSR